MRILVSGSIALVRRTADLWPEALGHIVTPRNNNTPASIAKTGLPWAIDNGAFSGFDSEAFVRLIDKAVGLPGLVFVAVPDVVGDATKTLALWPLWAMTIRSRGLPAAFVLQDGQEDLPLPDADAFFVGGSTAWKLGAAAAALVREARRQRKYCHMGRVNTVRRLEYAWRLGCDSVDGSIYSRMSDKFLTWALRRLKARQQQPLLFEGVP